MLGAGRVLSVLATGGAPPGGGMRLGAAKLGERHGIAFDRLHCITNMPINRYYDWLKEKG